MSDTLRRERVDALVRAALNGMTEVSSDASASEVFSACVTLGLRGVKCAVAQGGNRQTIRESVYQILLECAEDTRN